MINYAMNFDSNQCLWYYENNRNNFLIKGLFKTSKTTIFVKTPEINLAVFVQFKMIQGS